MSNSEKLKNLKKWYTWHEKSIKWYKNEISSLENDIKRKAEYNKKLSLKIL